MTINWSWPKATALSVVQASATTLTALLVGHTFLEIAWVPSLETAALTGFLTFLRAVAAYSAPSGIATSLWSASVGAAQDAADATPAPESHSLRSTAVSVHDERDARG